MVHHIIYCFSWYLVLVNINAITDGDVINYLISKVHCQCQIYQYELSHSSHKLLIKICFLFLFNASTNFNCFSIFFVVVVLSDAMESFDTGGDVDYGDDDNDDDDRVSII